MRKIIILAAALCFMVASSFNIGLAQGTMGQQNYNPQRPPVSVDTTTRPSYSPNTGWDTPLPKYVPTPYPNSTNTNSYDSGGGSHSGSGGGGGAR